MRWKVRIDEQLNLDGVVLSHKPLNGPRQDITHEVILTQAWSVLASRACDTPSSPLELDEPRSVLVDVLDQLPGCVSQRDATVCATFICWLGSNRGRGFLMHADRLAAEYPMMGRDTAYGLAWMKENRRMRSIDMGCRILDLILYNTDPQLESLDGPEVRDTEVVEHLVYWLASAKGQRFLKTTKEETSYRRSNDHHIKQENQNEHSE